MALRPEAFAVPVCREGSFKPVTSPLTNGFVLAEIVVNGFVEVSYAAEQPGNRVGALCNDSNVVLAQGIGEVEFHQQSDQQLHLFGVLGLE